ncbi:hypothetical protein [Providencia hangzhouensis]|uniref:hypothetical protein n=1 Tax=Providencia hangzhouensis TaxID=3031799 RepID=UPI0034DD3FA3
MKINKMKKTTLGLTLATFLASSAAMAAGETGSGVDLSALTDSIDFGSILVAIMAVAASITLLYAGMVGVKHVIRFVRGA